MTAREHAAVWAAAADRLENEVIAQTVEIGGRQITPSAAQAVANLARSVADGYAEFAEAEGRKP